MRLDGNVWPQRQGFFQAMLADEAPWTDHVGNDVDANRLNFRHAISSCRS
jgi:hypothetical protein